jgi:hypothetical protein
VLHMQQVIQLVQMLLNQQVICTGQNLLIQ